MMTTAHQELHWGPMALDVRTLPQRTKCHARACGEMMMTMMIMTMLMVMMMTTMMITKMRKTTTAKMMINM